MTALDEASMTEMLADWYGQNHGNGPRYAFAAQVRSHASFYARRTCDAIAMDLWARGRFALHGHEIKVSRSDWLAELKEPEKAAEFIPYVNYWWLVSGEQCTGTSDAPCAFEVVVRSHWDVSCDHHPEVFSHCAGHYDLLRKLLRDAAEAGDDLGCPVCLAIVVLIRIERIR